MLGIDFNIEKEKGKLKEDYRFYKSIWQRLGYTRFLCPKCNAHLKEAENGDLICLNGCHMPKEMLDNFQKKMVEVKHGK